MLKYNQKQLAFIILRRDFLMKRNVYRILGCFLFAFTLCIMTPSFAKASVKNIPQTKTSGTYVGNVDLTGDENADSVIIRTTPDQEGWYINRFTIYLNGKRITEISLRDHDCYYLVVKYAKMNKQHAFIQIIGRGENDYVTYNEIFTYNKKSNQFRVVKIFLMTALLTLKKSLLPIKKGLPLNIVCNLWKPDGSIGHCLINTVSKNSLELHLLQKLYEANSDKTEKINIPDILQKISLSLPKK